MEGYHVESDEPVGQPVSEFDFDFEYYSLKLSEFKELIYQEMQLYNSEEAQATYLENM